MKTTYCWNECYVTVPEIPIIGVKYLGENQTEERKDFIYLVFDKYGNAKLTTGYDKVVEENVLERVHTGSISLNKEELKTLLFA